VQRSVIFCHRSKQRGYTGIHIKLVGAYVEHAYPTESVKYRVRDDDRGRRDRAESPMAGRPRSDIAEAVSHILSRELFSSTNDIVA
jgi:hypothetical protein